MITVGGDPVKSLLVQQEPSIGIHHVKMNLLRFANASGSGVLRKEQAEVVSLQGVLFITMKIVTDKVKYRSISDHVASL